MPLPFAFQASAACPGQADLALALAAEFAAVDTVAADDALDALAAELAGIRAWSGEDQMAALGDVLSAFVAADAHAEPSLLMLDRVLERFAGHPTLLAIVASEVGTRAGVSLGIVGDGRRHLVAHRGLDEAIAVEPGRRGARSHEDESFEGMSWRCSHQVAFAVLGELIGSLLRCGDVGGAIRGAELRLALPLEDETADRLRHELAKLRAHLN